MLETKSENESEGVVGVHQVELRQGRAPRGLGAVALVRAGHHSRPSSSPHISFTTSSLTRLTAKIRFGGDEKDTRISGAGILGEDEGGGRDEEERKKRKEKVKRRESGVETEESNSERIERDFTKG